MHPAYLGILLATSLSGHLVPAVGPPAAHQPCETASSTVPVAEADRVFVVDRRTDDRAHLLFEINDETVGSRVVPIESLPDDGRSEGTILQRTPSGYEFDHRITAERATRANRRFDQLTSSLDETGDQAVG